MNALKEKMAAVIWRGTHPQNRAVIDGRKSVMHFGPQGTTLSPIETLPTELFDKLYLQAIEHLEAKKAYAKASAGSPKRSGGPKASISDLAMGAVAPKKDASARPILTIRREPLNRGGYTSSGRYFGTGAKLWAIEEDDGKEIHYWHVRAATKAEAKKVAYDPKWGGPYRPEFR
jgi:hypothetical protein